MQIINDEPNIYKQNSDQAYKIYDHRMRNSPNPKIVAKLLLKLTKQKKSNYSVKTVGTFFQAKLTNILSRLASKKMIRKKSAHIFFFKTKKSFGILNLLG